MRALDDFILDRLFQPVVDFAGRRFGWTQWQIARQTFIGCIAAGLLYVGARSYAAGTLPPLLAIWLPIMTAWAGWRIILIGRLSNDKEGGAKLRASEMVTRLFYLAILGADFVSAKP